MPKLLMPVAVTFVLVSAMHAEERRPIGSIACILSEFVHTCSPAQCGTLRAIVEEKTSTVSEGTLAAALLRVDHVPHPHDRAQLRELVANPFQTAEVRAIAGVLDRLVHTPSDADRAALAAVAPEPGCHDAASRDARP